MHVLKIERLLEYSGNETNAMAGIAPLKAHLVKTTYNEQSQPSKTWNGGRHITGSASLDVLCALGS